MEDEVNKLVEKTWTKFQNVPLSERLLIAVSGIPGSGKTTLAVQVTQRLNALFSGLHGKTSAPPIAGFVSMDGFHLYRSQLDALPDPANAHARRGAAFTFDGDAFLALVQKVRQPLTPTSPTLYAPSFDHAVKDPKENDIAIEPTTRILVFEGNYLALNKAPWKDAAALMDELWFVDVDFEIARKRLVPRHIAAGIAASEEEADRRVTGNDLVNGSEIVENRLEVHEILHSS